MTRERNATIYFFLIGFMIASYGLLVWSYKLMVPEIEKDNLVNPLQVLAQLSCILFLFRYPVAPARLRMFLLQCFLFSLLSSLYMRGIDEAVIFLFLLFVLIVIVLFPLDDAHLIIFLGYFLDQALAKWGFYLAFQLVGYSALSFFLERGQSSVTPKHRFFSFFCLLLVQTLYGLVHFGDFYLSEPVKLAALLSGACIIFLSLAKRTTWAYLLAFFLYFIISVCIGVMLYPGDKATLWGFPPGVFIFTFLHLWFFLGLCLFNKYLPKKRQALIPLFFGGVFFFLGYFPELTKLEKWIEGIDLLLLFLSLVSFIEEEKTDITNDKDNLGRTRKSL